MIANLVIESGDFYSVLLMIGRKVKKVRLQKTVRLIG